MKKTIWILFVIILSLLSFQSCEKNYCYQCAWDQGITTPIQICDKTQAEIDQYEIDNSFVLSTGQKVNMKCERQ